MKITLNQKQMNFLKSTSQNTGFCAGLGSGKSFVATLKTILKKTKFPDCTVAYYLPTYGLIRDIAFDKFPTMLSEMGYKYKLNKSDKEIHIEDFGKIIFRSMDSPENIVGYETFYTIIDECDILPMEKMTTAYNKILGRNREVVEVESKDIPIDWEVGQELPKGMYLHQELNALCWENQIDVASTPEGFKWFYTRYVKEFNKDTDLLVRASTYENKHLPPTYIKGLEQQYPPALLKAYLEGEFVNLASGTIYNYFDREEHHTNREIEPYDVLHIGQDFNVGGCCGRIHVIDNGVPKLIQEYSVKDTQSIITYLQDRFNDHKMIIYPDASGDSNKTNSNKSDIQLLRDAGFRIDMPLKNPNVKDRINTVNNKFYRSEYLVNVNNCPDSTLAFEQQAYNDKGEPEKFNGANTIDDSTDACGYFIHRKFGIDKSKGKAVKMNFG